MMVNGGEIVYRRITEHIVCIHVLFNLISTLKSPYKRQQRITRMTNKIREQTYGHLFPECVSVLDTLQPLPLHLLLTVLQSQEEADGES